MEPSRFPDGEYRLAGHASVQRAELERLAIVSLGDLGAKEVPVEILEE